MATRSLNVVITGDAKQLGIATDKAGKHMADVESRGVKMGKALAGGFAAAGAAAAGALVVGLKKSVDAAIDAEASMAKVKKIVDNAGISFDRHAKEIDKVIQAHSRLTGFDDEDLAESFANMVRTTGSLNEAFKLNALAADIARSKGMELAGAQSLLARVYNGSFTGVKRLGIAIEPVTKAQDALKESTKHATVEQERAAKAADKTATRQAALAALQKSFGGQAEAYGKTAAGAQARFRVAVENLQERIGAGLLPVITRVTNAVSKFVTQMDTGTGAGGRFARNMEEVADSIRPVVKGIGSVVSWFGRHKTATDASVAAMVPFISSARTIVRVLNAIADAANGVVKAVKSIGGAFSSAAETAKSVAGALNPFGDGPGKMSIPNVPNFGGGLMGARPSLAPFAAAGARFGLHVSSGKRPGSITSSGNVSYHSSGEALDQAGSPAGMLGFFRQMKSKYGSRLAELIYTPGGVGVKDGKPYRYTGAVAADHFDHVHVAFDSGVPGVGDGLGKFVATSYGPPWGGIQGTGTTATGVDLHSGPHRYGVAVDPSVIPLGSKLRITPNPFNYGGAFEAFDTGGAIKGNRIDFYDWRGRKAQYGWGTKTVTVSTVGGGSVSSKDSSKGKSKSGSVTAKLGGDADPAAIYATPDFTDPQQRVATRLAGGKVPAVPGALLGPTGMKGRAADQGADATDQPTEADFIDAAIAEAALTPGNEDDVAAAGAAVGMWERELAAARASGDPRRIVTAASGVKGSRDTLKALQDVVDNTAALAQAIKDNTAEIKRQTDFASSVQTTNNFQLTKNFADLLSGQIVGYGVAGRAFTPGRGVEHVY